ncbi:Beta-lactamase CTX-M-1 precursor [compost metagenome]
MRSLTWLAAASVLLIDLPGGAATPTLHDRLAELECASGGRLGVVALGAANQPLVTYRADERFPFCSTFKALLAGAILHRSASSPGLLAERIPYTKDQLVTYSPITEQHVGAGMTVAGLCAAAIQHSDNTAANLLIARLGGPDAVTAFARSIGDTQFRLDRWETALNTAIPGDVRDTTTPAAMAHSLRRLALGESLLPSARTRLTDWLRGNTTGATRIRAGVPAAWQVGDKTGTGDYGTTNDIAVLWPSGKPPVVLAVYFTQRNQHAAARSDVIAEAARLVAEAID